ncbi:hypothetical protein ACFXDP_32450, partial [Streptomyces sp. NPDC059374]
PSPTVIDAAHAPGAARRDWGGTDRCATLNATGPAPQKAAGKSADAQEDKDDDSPFGVWWYIGVFLVVGIGIGFLLSHRNKGGRA